MPTKKPQVGRPASLRAFSLSRTLPPLRLPRSAAPLAPNRPRPQVSKPPAMAAPAAGCSRCSHPPDDHPIRYACDKYPFEDQPLQICGCVTDVVVDLCPSCGHKARSHKPRRRCRLDDCHCWGFQE